MIQTSQIIDLSHDLFVNMPSYPTLPSFKIEYLKLAARDGSTVSLITSMHMHLGTHIDFPSHLLPDSKCLEHYTLQHLSGEGVVIDLSYKKEGEEITERDLLKSGSCIKKRRDPIHIHWLVQKEGPHPYLSLQVATPQQTCSPILGQKAAQGSRDRWTQHRRVER
jgi:kynurenine formamidase